MLEYGTPSVKKPLSPGISFEKAVAAIHGMMDTEAMVMHNQRITDKHGHSRQFDVVIRGKLGSYEMLGVIECKDWKRKVGTQEVEAFVTKARGVNANLTLLASKSGFTKPALEKARHYGIGTISLLPKDPKNSGFSVGMEWYAEVYSWSNGNLEMHYVAKKPPVTGFSVKDVKIRDKLVVDWFLKELATTYVWKEKQGWISLPITFQRPRKLAIKGKRFLVRGLTFRALRVCNTKKRWVQLSGDGLLDWNKSILTIPPSGQVFTDGFRPDFSDWEEYEGDIPPPTGIFDGRFKTYSIPFDPKSPVVDLSKL